MLLRSSRAMRKAARAQARVLNDEHKDNVERRRTERLEATRERNAAGLLQLEERRADRPTFSEISAAGKLVRAERKKAGHVTMTMDEAIALIRAEKAASYAQEQSHE